MARAGSRAKLGVVLLAPVALAFGALGLFIGATPRGLVESSGVTGPTRGGWAIGKPDR